MSIVLQAVLGLLVFLLGYGLSAWAARYDVRSWITDAAWRVLFRRRWREAASKPLADVDEELKAQIKGTVEAYKADSARLGHARATVKRGGLFALACAVNIVALPIMLIGLVVLVHAAYRWLA